MLKRALKSFTQIQKGTVATPDKKVLLASIKKASAPYKASTVTSAESFKARCLAQRHCLVLLTNSSERFLGDASASATAAAAEATASANRALRVVVVDGASLDFSLARALPSPAPWSNGRQELFAPQALYLRSLSSKERALLAQPLTPPAALRVHGLHGDGLHGDDSDGEGEGEVPVSASRCSKGALLSANATAAEAIFNRERLSERGWATKFGEAKGEAKGEAELEDLVFAVGSKYLSWRAAQRWLVGRALFGARSGKAVGLDALDAAALAHPLVTPQVPNWGARAFRPSDSGFSSKGKSGFRARSSAA